MEPPRLKRAKPRIESKAQVYVLLFVLYALWALFWTRYLNTEKPSTANPNVLPAPKIRGTGDVNKQPEHISGPLQDEKVAVAQKTLMYWHIPTKEASVGLFRQPDNLDRYVLFKSDCGGFNNIRMAFEYFYMTAWLTKRTLVLPPPHAWYLIDNGPMQVMKPDPNEKRVTDYSDFFDLEHMQAAVPVISTEEFRQRERKNLPEDLLAADLSTKAGQKVYEAFMKNSEDHPCLAWNPLAHLVYFPSIQAVETAYKDKGGVPKNVVHHRKPVEFTPEIYQARYIAFPSCMKGDWKGDDMRFLGQMAKYGAFENEMLGKAFKRTLRDHVHFPQIVFEIAAKVVAWLGLFEYTALHVRRNELQYKEVFMSAAQTLENIRPILRKGESIYLATDETNPDFFKAIADEHPIFKWDDFFTAKGGNILTNVKIPRKLIGCIEQVICSGGRAFMGTLESTFTSYIFRLRGYVGTPNTEVYFHTLKYYGDRDKDREITWSKKPERGQVYQTEHRDMWEDLNF